MTMTASQKAKKYKVFIPFTRMGVIYYKHYFSSDSYANAEAKYLLATQATLSAVNETERYTVGKHRINKDSNSGMMDKTPLRKIIDGD